MGTYKFSRIGALCVCAVGLMVCTVQASQPRNVEIAVVDAAGNLMPDVHVDWVTGGADNSRIAEASPGVWNVKGTTADGATVQLSIPGDARAEVKLDLPSRDVSVLVRWTNEGARAEYVDQLADLKPGRNTLEPAKTVPPVEVPANKAAVAGAPGAALAIGDDCSNLPSVAYSNGTYDTNDPDINSLSAERRTDGSLARFVVDDATLAADTNITGIHWWGNDPVTMNWTGTADYIVLNDAAGAPGSVFDSGAGVPATRIDTLDGPLFGDPIQFYSITGLNINLTAGTWWFGFRAVQDVPVGGQAWLVIATYTVNGLPQPQPGSPIYLDYGPSTPNWDPGVSVFGADYNLAFCLSGSSGPPPYGACCDNLTGVCEDCVQGTCDPGSLFFAETRCEDIDPPCGQITGACCDIVVGGCTDVPPSQCDTASGDFIFQGEFTSCATAGICPCVVPCPQGALAEGEPLCGEDYDDTYNGGCNSVPEVFQMVACGDTICGEAGTFTFGVDDYRDTDWYELTITTEQQITWSVEAEFPVSAFIVDTTAGCAGATVIASATGDECEKVDLTQCLGPGTYWLLVLPSVFTGIDCGSDYTVSLDCAPCPTGGCCPGDGTCVGDVSSRTCDLTGGVYLGDDSTCSPNPCPANDSCDVAEAVTLGTPVFGNNEYAGDDAAPTCGTSSPGAGLWYTVVGNGNTLTASTIFAGTDFDTKIQVFCDCGPAGCIGGNDDSGGTLQSSFSWCSLPGHTYYIHVGGFSTARGNFELHVTDGGSACSTAIPCTGACCVMGTCDSTSGEAACDGAGGQWFQGEACPAFMCPAPVAETCDVATVIPSVPFSSLVDNDLAAAGTPAAAQTGCNSTSATVMQNDTWWTYTPTVDCLLSATIDPTTYDGVGAIYSGPDCNNLSLLTCDDEPEPYTLIVSATAGTQYWIQAGDWGTAEGGGLTTIDVTCAPLTVTGACCIADGSCTEVNAGDCLTAGGSYSGDGTSCTPNDCPQPGADTCDLAIPVTPGTPATYLNTSATDDITTACGLSSGPFKNIWFSVVGTGNQMTASFCNPGTTHPDTTMSVFCNNCAQLTCVGGNDQGGGTCGNDSQFTWCSQAGTTYYITVGGWLSSTGTGPVELLVTEGASCSTPPNCSPAYCASGATSSADSLCGKVALNGYVNDTTGTCATYSDFTGASVTTLNQGSMYSVDVTVDTCGGCYGKWAKVFIDWNQDLDFTDAGEQVYTSGATSSSCPQTFSGSFTVPAGATLGDTRMRVVVRESGSESSTTSCGTFTWGETEDYTITVGPSSPVVQGPWDDDDGDEVPNFCDNCPNDANAGQEDADGDGNGDPCDICPGFDDFADADGDTVPDGCDACPGFDDFADADGDTVADGCDNCPNIPNTNQADGDGDGVGNVCDNCPNTANPTQVDSDGDGNGNACDLCPGFDDYDDADGDGVPGNGTGCDQCPDKPDGAEGALGDDDGDGVLNCNDQCIGVDDAVFAPGCVGQIPAASEWGLAVLALLLLVGGKLYFGRREAALS